MEQQILDVLQRNTVQAVAVEKVENEPNSPSRKNGIVGRFFGKGRRWGKKKNTPTTKQSEMADDFFGIDRKN